MLGHLHTPLGKSLRSASLYTHIWISFELLATSATGSPEQLRCIRFALPEFVEFADPDTTHFVTGLRGTTCDVRFVSRRSLPSCCESDAMRLRLRDVTPHHAARRAVHFSRTLLALLLALTGEGECREAAAVVAAFAIAISDGGCDDGSRNSGVQC